MSTTRTRAVAAQWQLAILKRFYEYNEFPTDEVCNQAAISTGLGLAWIKDWFTRQRSRARNGFCAPATREGPTIPTPRQPAAPSLRPPQPPVDDPVPGEARGGSHCGPGCGDWNEDTHISTAGLGPPRRRCVPGRPADSLQGLLIAVPGPLIAGSPGAKSASNAGVLSLSSIQRSLRGNTPSGNPSSFSGGERGYPDFSTMLANTFPEFAHIRNRTAEEEKGSSESIVDDGRPQTGFPVSYITRRDDLTATVIRHKNQKANEQGAALPGDPDDDDDDKDERDGNSLARL